MNFEEVQNSANEWLWDNDLRTYFWILNADSDTKMIHAKGLNGLPTTMIFSANRFFKNAKPRAFAGQN